MYESSKSIQQPISGKIGVVYPTFKYLSVDEITEENKMKFTKILQDQILHSLSKLTKANIVEFVPISEAYDKVDAAAIQKKYQIDYLLHTTYTFLDYDNNLEALLTLIITDFSLFISEGKHKVDFSLHDITTQSEIWSFTKKGNSSNVGVSNMMYLPRRELKKIIALN